MPCTMPPLPRHQRYFRGSSLFRRCFWLLPFTGYLSAATEDITTTIQLWDSHGELGFFCFCFCFLGVLPFCCFYFISSFLLIEFSLNSFVSSQVNYFFFLFSLKYHFAKCFKKILNLISVEVNIFIKLG